MTKQLTPFETETCSRCLGSGHHSYCQRFGTICFRCSGHKLTYTKRGAAANAYFRQLRSKPLSELKPGDVIRVEDITMNGQCFERWTRIESIEPDATVYVVNGVSRAGYLKMTTGRCVHHGLSPDHMYLVKHPAESHNALLAQALEYQANLTKQGKPRKRARKTEAA